ncbi:hypothetical protein HDU86_001295 [Geranomyces michiganensis]|nr:hypothetical protein HDU86_001295 [Geranomyces michiganensis]
MHFSKISLACLALAGSALAHPKKCHAGTVTSVAAGNIPTYAPGGEDGGETGGETTTIVVLPPVTTSLPAGHSSSVVVIPGTTTTAKVGASSTVITRAPATTTVAAHSSTVIVIPGTTVIATPVSQPTGVISPDGTCGVKGFVCALNHCCSRFGFCGSTAEFCGTGCNPAAGFCLPTSTRPPVPKVTGLTGRTPVSGGKVIENCVNPGEAALTFDDGPYIWDEKLFTLLKAANIRATFFQNGNNYGCMLDDEVGQRVKDAIAGGHQVASHTWAHPTAPEMPFNKLTHAQVNYQIRKNEDAFMRTIGKTPKYFRPPQGLISPAQVQQISNLGYKIINWSVDTGDSIGVKVPGSEKILDDAFNKEKQQHPIILNHETYKTTVEQVIPYLIKHHKDKFSKWVTVAECLGDKSEPYMTVPLLTGSNARDGCTDDDRYLSLADGL